MNVIDGKEPLQAILNSLTDGVIIANMDGEFQFYNPAAEKILGLGPINVPMGVMIKNSC